MKAAAPTLAFVTLGCPKNQVDSEAMLGLLAKDGFRPTGNPGAADLVVVNTCAFLGSAVEESRRTIRSLARLKKTGKLKGLVVAGCWAQRDGTNIASEIPGVDAVLGTGSVEKIVGLSRAVLSRNEARGKARRAPGVLDEVGEPGGALVPLPRALSTPRHLAYLKISEGCDHRCTFCIIPHLRGDQRSRPLASLVEEARLLAAAGVRELVLIGQDTTAYGIDLPGPDRPRLSTLLKALGEIEELVWIRVMYTYPREWDEELMETLGGHPKLVKYVDMPLQHIHDVMLRRMARASNREKTEKLLGEIRRRIPGVSLRTSFIVGFPGETKEHFESLLSFVRDLEFDKVVVFAYEPEREAPSSGFTGRVPERVKQSRRERLLLAQQEISSRRLARRVGAIETVLVDGRAEDGRWAARTQGEAYEVDGNVFVEAENLEAGDFARVRITGAGAYDLWATALEPLPVPISGAAR
ncbi:MAG: 30S ribosomal protein S12 methylthiotransferase RimO [Candidatus Eiseniibacteriota bacterium]